jgi:hypothetical protein
MSRISLSMLGFLVVCLLVLAGCAGGLGDLDNSSGGDSAEQANCWDYQPENGKPKEGWEELDLAGMTRDELTEALGCPLHSMRQTALGDPAFTRELWIYLPYDEDPTGLYVWLQGGLFHASRLDEFSGFWGFEFDNPEFWE